RLPLGVGWSNRRVSPTLVGCSALALFAHGVYGSGCPCHGQLPHRPGDQASAIKLAGSCANRSMYGFNCSRVSGGSGSFARLGDNQAATRCPPSRVADSLGLGDWQQRKGLIWGFAITLMTLLGAAQYVLPGW